MREKLCEVREGERDSRDEMVISTCMEFLLFIRKYVYLNDYIESVCCFLWPCMVKEIYCMKKGDFNLF